MNVYITGFGPFAGVKENPTSVLVGELIKNEQTAGYQGINIVDLSIVGVSIEDCDSHIQNVRDKIAQHSQSNPGQRYLILNLGVNPNETCFNLESRAQNMMNFGKTADNRGNTPNNVPIDQKTYELNARTRSEDILESRLDLV